MSLLVMERSVHLRQIISWTEARLMKLRLPWEFPVDQRAIAPEVRSVIIVLSQYLYVCTYLPNLSLQCLWELIVCPVTIPRGLRILDKPSYDENTWIQKKAVNTRTMDMTAGILLEERA